MSEYYKIMFLGMSFDKICVFSQCVPEYAESNGCSGVIILDVDGCIRDGSHRIHLLPTKEEILAAGDEPNLAFEFFNEESHLDTPIPSIIDVSNMFFGRGFMVIVLTSCTSSDHTLNALTTQLQEWGVNYDALVMRGKDNHLFPVDFKQQFIYDSGLDKFEGVKYALDDCPKNCDMFRENGFTALQVENWSRFNK